MQITIVSVKIKKTNLRLLSHRIIQSENNRRGSFLNLSTNIQQPPVFRLLTARVLIEIIQKPRNVYTFGSPSARNTFCFLRFNDQFEQKK